MADIFISYAREDREKAATLARVFEDRRWTVWWDREIELGLPFDEVIERELRASRCVVVIWTTDSVGSRWVRREARTAAKDAKLVPILAGKVDLPWEFEGLQTADLATWQKLDGHPEFEKVVRRIGALAPPTDGTAPPVARAGQPVTHQPAPDPGPVGSRRSPLGFVAAVALAVAALATGAVYLAMRPGPTVQTKDAIPAVVPPSPASPVPSGVPTVQTKEAVPTVDTTAARYAPAYSPDNAPPSRVALRPSSRPRYTRTDFQVSVDHVGYFNWKEFEIARLDPARNFTLVFKVRSTRAGGSTRYGIAWNYEPDDFLLFTLHSISGGYYSIGAGKSTKYQPFARFSQGRMEINAEREPDALEMKKHGDVLTFSVNGREVWSTRDYRLQSNRFAFWAGDASEAVMSSYVVTQ